MYRQQLPRQHISQNQIVAVQGTGVCVCEMSCHTPVDGMVDDRVKGLLHIICETVDDRVKRFLKQRLPRRLSTCPLPPFFSEEFLYLPGRYFSLCPLQKLQEG